MKVLKPNKYITCLAVGLLILVITPLWCDTSSAAHVNGKEALEQYRIARSLERRGHYFDAVTEYKRFLFFLPEHRRVPHVLYRITNCSYHLHDWKNVLKYAELFQNSSQKEPLLSRVKLLEAKALINTGRPRKAISILNTLQRKWKGRDEKLEKEISALIGRSFLVEGDIEKARHVAEQKDQLSGVKYKDPRVAGISAALIPGLGHVYDGRPRDAWTAFFYTSILAAISWEAAKNDNPWLAGVSGTAAATFYAGNIFSAVNMACKHNRVEESRRLNNYFSRYSKDIFVDIGSLSFYTETQQREQHGVKTRKRRSPFSWFFLAGIRAFRKMVSPIDNKQCPSYPSCSSYGLMALKKHGAFWGTMLTIDRLIHEPSESRLSTYVIIDGRKKIYDPLEANDFLLR